jgi:NAD(P)-dependent dehydrogenase (short-subunit alcohol dehydrogenase family)
MSTPLSYGLTEKTILVTGGAGFGVGAGVCESVAEAGGRLVIADLDGDKARATAAKFHGAIAVSGDVSSEADVERMFRELDGLGITADGLVNNAGAGLSTPSHLATAAQFDRVYGVDMRGLWLMTRAFVGRLVAQRRPGAVVNISSVHAHATIGQYGLYAGAKGAVEAYTRGAAVELGPHFIRVNAVAPGYVHAEQNETLIATWAEDARAWIDRHTRFQQAIPREITAVDCGRTAVFLLSDAARSITGQTLRVDNGSTCQLYPGDFVPLNGKWKAS